MPEQWYYRFLDQEIGPVDIETLRNLATNGSLSSGDLVRTDSDPDWRPVETVAGILPDAAGSADLDAMLSDSPGAADLDSMLSPSTPANETRTRSDTRGDCYCRLLGQELGPMSLDELTRMAADGELSESDEVKLGAGAEWVPAASVVGLIPQEKQRKRKKKQKKSKRVSEGDIEAILRGDDDRPGESPAAPPAHVAPQRLAVPAQRPPDAHPTSGATRPPAASDEGDNLPDHVTPRHRTEAESASGGNADRTASTGVQRPMPAASSPASPAPPPLPSAAAPPPAPRKSRGNPLAGLSSGINSVAGSLRGQGKLIGLVIGVALIVGLITLAAPSLGARRGNQVYAETLAIWEEALRLKSTESESGQWTAFSDRVAPRVTQLADELTHEASAKKRLLQLMLYCHRDCLPKILDGGSSAPEAVWEEMEAYMSEAAGLVKK